MKTLKWVGIIFGIFFGIVVINLVFNPTTRKPEQKAIEQKMVATKQIIKESKPAPKYSQKQIKALEEAINGFVEEGLLRKINPQLNEAFVEPLKWYAIEYEYKEMIAFYLAQYCAFKKKSETEWVIIRDSLSGKTLAKYGVWGFKTY